LREARKPRERLPWSRGCLEDEEEEEGKEDDEV